MLLMIKVKVVIEEQNTYTIQKVMPYICPSTGYSEIGGSNLHTEKDKLINNCQKDVELKAQRLTF